jgi:Fe-S-cluster containining protein
MPKNYCMTCGACCALFPVRIELSEIDDRPGGAVPFYLTTSVNAGRWMMKGTEGHLKRCVALKGNIGYTVSCLIYDKRPLSCRNFLAAWEHNILNPLCDRARVAYGMYPFCF